MRITIVPILYSIKEDIDYEILGIVTGHRKSWINVSDYYFRPSSLFPLISPFSLQNKNEAMVTTANMTTVQQALFLSVLYMLI